MSSLVFLIPIALLLGGAALVAFLWSLRSGQYEDLEGPAHRILADDDAGPPAGTSAAPSSLTTVNSGKAGRT